MTAPTRLRVATVPLVTVGVLLLASVAWALLVWPAGPLEHGADHATGGPEMPGHEMAGHDMTGAGAAPSGSVVGSELGLLLVGWTVMVVAMMLPPALPLLRMLAVLVARQPRPLLLVALAAAVFVGVWTVAGAVLLGTHAALQVGRATVPALVDRPAVVAGVVLVGAGIYQLSPLADRCLRACRTPRSFAVAYWRGARPARREAVAIAAAYAVSCVGCCWALMAVSLVVAVAALPVMVLLAVVMAAQRLLPHGRRLVRPVGLLTVGLGLLALAGLVPAGLFT